jgi:hypothetical protein
VSASSNRRWSFSLRTLFIAVMILGTAGYWIARRAAFERANHAYDRAYAEWQAELILTSELCKTSQALFQAQVDVPFSDRSKAAASYLVRMDKLKLPVLEGPAWDFDIGTAERAEFSRY